MSRIPERIRDFDRGPLNRRVGDSSGEIGAGEETTGVQNPKPKVLKRLHKFIQESHVDNPDSELATQAIDLSLVKEAKKIVDGHYWDLCRLRRFTNYHQRLEALSKGGLEAAYENLVKEERVPLFTIRNEIDQALRLSGFTKIGKDLKEAGEFFEKKFKDLRAKSDNFHKEVKYLAGKGIRLASYRNPYDSELIDIEIVKNASYEEACSLFETLSSSLEAALKIINEAQGIDLSMELGDFNFEGDKSEKNKKYPSEASAAIVKAFYLAQIITAEFKRA